MKTDLSTSKTSINLKTIVLRMMDLIHTTNTIKDPTMITRAISIINMANTSTTSSIPTEMIKAIVTLTSMGSKGGRNMDKITTIPRITTNTTIKETNNQSHGVEINTVVSLITTEAIKAEANTVIVIVSMLVKVATQEVIDRISTMTTERNTMDNLSTAKKIDKIMTSRILMILKNSILRYCLIKYMMITYTLSRVFILMA